MFYRVAASVQKSQIKNDNQRAIAQTADGVGNSPIRKLHIIGPRGDEAFSEMPGGRALSFHGLSVGETPGPERRRGEQREGAELPHG